MGGFHLLNYQLNGMKRYFSIPLDSSGVSHLVSSIMTLKFTEFLVQNILFDPGGHFELPVFGSV
jgi:hypothetical protein